MKFESWSWFGFCRCTLMVMTCEASADPISGAVWTNLAVWLGISRADALCTNAEPVINSKTESEAREGFRCMFEPLFRVVDTLLGGPEETPAAILDEAA